MIAYTGEKTRVADPDPDTDPDPAFFLIADPDPDLGLNPGFCHQIEKKFTVEKKFWIQNCNLVILSLHKGCTSYRRNLQP
jgi:hypothetical protein